MKRMSFHIYCQITLIFGIIQVSQDRATTPILSRYNALHQRDHRGGKSRQQEAGWFA